jgi:aspartate ammonia-lyase
LTAEGIANLLREVNLGGTAIGTGINTPGLSDGHPPSSKVSGVDQMPPAIIEATSDMGALSLSRRAEAHRSQAFQDLHDLGLLNRPQAGWRNPPAPAGRLDHAGQGQLVVPVVNQIAYQVIGSDLTVTLAAEAGQLQLNAMEPVIVSTSCNPCGC